jgi:hypothetical protein
MKLLGYCTRCAGMIGDGEKECGRCGEPVIPWELEDTAPDPAEVQTEIQSHHARHPLAQAKLRFNSN